MSAPALTPRERAVLAAVERRQSNPEIAAELFLSVRTVESHIASLRRKLVASSRADLIAAARGLRRTAVRVPPDPLRGRGADLTAVRALLRPAHIVTIVGPGGVGKTRLALEVAGDGAGGIPLVVELEHASEDDVATRIARALGLDASADDVTGALAVALAASEYLLVLDNADRVGAATAEIVTTMRMRVPALRVLVTSRTPLGVAGESVYVLHPLATGGAHAPASVLLRDRLRAAGADDGDDESVDRIAARLDGLPLALELVASVARHLPLHDLATRPDGDLAALDRASPAGRHRCLQTAFDWTWDLLTAQEQDVLCRLAALPRTFDLDLATAVTGPDAAGVVLRLLDRSLVVPTRTTPGRFRLLAVLREFVHARTDPALIRDVLERHAVAMTSVAVQFTATARTDASPAAMHRSTVLCPEVNAAVRWMLAAGHPATLELATALAIGVEQYGADLDSIDALAAVAHDDGVVAAATPQQLLALGTALSFANVELVTALAERALAIARTEDDARAAHQLAGFAAAYRGDTDAALAHCDEAERLAAAAGRTWDLGSIAQTRGLALRAASRTADALAAFALAMDAYARAGDAVHVNNVRYMMASVAAEDPADHDRAREWAAEARATAEAMGNAHETAHARLVQARLGLAEAGDLDDLVATFRGLGDVRCLDRALALRASAAPARA